MQLKYSNYVAFSHDYGFAVNNSGLNKNDSHLINIFSVTVLEILGNDKAILKVAKQYMGEKTALLQMKVDKELGRL